MRLRINIWISVGAWLKIGVFVNFILFAHLESKEPQERELNNAISPRKSFDLDKRKGKFVLSRRVKWGSFQFSSTSQISATMFDYVNFTLKAIPYQSYLSRQVPHWKQIVNKLKRVLAEYQKSTESTFYKCTFKNRAKWY